MPTKHFLNDPKALVSGSLKALQAINPAVIINEEDKIVRLSPAYASNSTVRIISGGGSGHEPAFGAYVGRGLLTASVAGTIFASPSSRQVLRAIEAVDGSKGILVVVSSPGHEMIVVGDDVGVPRWKAGKVGRRGIAGTVLVQKMIGALAAAGYDFVEVAKLGRLVCENLVSIGVSLERVHVPGQSHIEESNQNIRSGEVELGIGIHNEAGNGRRSGLQAELPTLVREMLRELLDINDSERGFLQVMPTTAVLLVNNLGGLSMLELGSVTSEIVQQVHDSYGIHLARVYSGTFMTSLNGLGFSITLLNHATTGLGLDMLQLLDAPSEATGWTAPVLSKTWERSRSPEKEILKSEQPATQARDFKLQCDLSTLISRLQKGLERVIMVEPEITKFDLIVGDGDCGTTMKRGAEAVRAVCIHMPPNLLELLLEICEAVECSMDGTSGALYSIFLNSLTQYFSVIPQDSKIVEKMDWIKALEHATATLSRYTSTRKGDRTLVDALHPFQEALVSGKDLDKAVEASVAGAESTKHMRAKLGRAVYVGEEDSWIGTIPDPGAWGLSKFFQGLVE